MNNLVGVHREGRSDNQTEYDVTMALIQSILQQARQKYKRALAKKQYLLALKHLALVDYLER